MIISAIVIIVLLFAILLFARDNLKGVLFFIALLPFLSRAIGIGIGTEVFALTLRRLILTLLAILLVIRNFQSFGTISIDRNVGKFFLLPMIGFIFVSVLASWRFQNSFYFIFPMIEDIVLIFFVVFVASNFAEREDTLERILKAAFYYPLLVLIPLLSLEFFLNNNLPSYILSVDDFTISDAAVRVLDEHIRFGRNRLQGFSDSPLHLAEYLTYCIAPLLFLQKIGAISTSRLIPVVVASMLAIFFTGSRAAIVVSLLILVFYTILSLSYRFRTLTFSFATTAVSVAGLLVTFFAIEYFAHVLSFGQLEVDEQSSFARIYQFRYFSDPILDSPIIGHGYVRHFGHAFGIGNFDVFWLGPVLQSGFVGLTLFLIPIVSVFFFVFRHIGKKNVSKYSIELSRMVLSMLVGFTIFKFVFSFPESNIYIFILAAVYFTYTGKRSRASEKSWALLEK